jgi:hypothetical protein
MLVSEQETQLSSQQTIIFALFDCPIVEISGSEALPIMQCPLLIQHNFAFAEETGAFIGKINPNSTKKNMTFFKSFSLMIILRLYISIFNMSNCNFHSICKNTKLLISGLLPQGF